MLFSKVQKTYNNFWFKDPFPQIPTSSLVHKFQCGLCNEFCCGECVSYLAIRSGEQTGISPLSNKREQLRKNSAVCHHLLHKNKVLHFDMAEITSLENIFPHIRVFLCDFHCEQLCCRYYINSGTYLFLKSRCFLNKTKI